MRTSIIRKSKSKTRVCCSGHDTIYLIFSTSFLRKCVSTERRKYKYKIFVASGARERRVVRVAHASGRPSGVQSCSRDGGGLLRRLLIFLLSSFYFVDALFLSPFSFQFFPFLNWVPANNLNWFLFYFINYNLQIVDCNWQSSLNLDL